MTRTLLNVILGVILACLVAVNWFGQRDYRHPNVKFMPNMVQSVPFDTFAPNPNFADGKTLQAPPPGTIPHGAQPMHYGPTTQEAVRAGKELSNPYSGTDAIALERGALVYQRFCLPCHGPTGAGDGLVAKLGFPPPPALSAAHAQEMKDGQLFHIITYGQGNMPPYDAQIAAPDRWRAVLHLRKLQSQAAPSPATTRSTTQPDTKVP